MSALTITGLSKSFGGLHVTRGVNLDVGDPILAKTLLDLSQTASINDSLRLER